jgi:hypothetical protein
MPTNFTLTLMMLFFLQQSKHKMLPPLSMLKSTAGKLARHLSHSSRDTQ